MQSGTVKPVVTHRRLGTTGECVVRATELSRVKAWLDDVLLLAFSTKIASQQA